MRIVAGAWRGRALVAPPGQGTRPTADRVRQALFDMLMHADWGGRDLIERREWCWTYLPAPARWDWRPCRVEPRQRASSSRMRQRCGRYSANISGLQGGGPERDVLAGDVMTVPLASRAASPPHWCFSIRPMARSSLLERLPALSASGRVGHGALIVAETRPTMRPGFQSSRCLPNVCTEPRGYWCSGRCDQ